MNPGLPLLDAGLISRVLDEAFQLLEDPGIRISDSEALDLLARAGARTGDGVAHIPKKLTRRALESAPRQFQLFDRDGQPTVKYGGDRVHYDPGSCAPHILDGETGTHRNATSTDLANIVRVVEQLPQFAAQSTAVVCHDVPPAEGEILRLEIVLRHSRKPIVTGAFTPQGIPPMLELLTADAGGEGSLRARPRAIFDVCPSPPLHWTAFACRCLIELGRHGVPVEIVSMPLAGATAPVTLIGSITQHASECLAGVTIHQLAAVGAPIVWGGAPAIFDMRSGTTPMGAIETAMLCCAYAEIGKSLHLPTHAYLCASDSKMPDAQAGMESAMSCTLGALTGINMISGAGMLDYLNCFSLEKLILDAEAIASLQRLQTGIDAPQPTLAKGTFDQVGLSSDFLKLKETRALFRSQQHLPSAAIDRGTLRAWEESGHPDALQRAHIRVRELLQAPENGS
jgi:trimethylamine--corrinoid protein Co-methyltransferase